LNGISSVADSPFSAIAMVPIVLEDGDLAVANCLDDSPYDGRFAGAGTAGDADHEWR